MKAMTAKVGSLVGLAAVLVVLGSIPVGAAIAAQGIQGSHDGSRPGDVGADCGDHTLHEPIRITEDHGPQGFTWTNPLTGEAEPRPGSGVVSGEGTEQAPFVIEGWCIPTPPTPASNTVVGLGVGLEGTDAHVVVKENLVLGPAAYGAASIEEMGLWAGQARNVSFEGNTVLGHGNGGIVVGLGSDGSIVRANTVQDNAKGIDVYAHDVHVVGNTVSGTTNQGIGAWFVDDVHIEGNTVEASASDGIWLLQTQGALVEANTLVGNHNGLSIVSSTDARAIGNVIQDSVVDGLTAWSTPGVVIEGNEADGNGRFGIRTHQTADAIVRSNVATANEEGLVADAFDGLTLEGNTATGNSGPGIHLFDVNQTTAPRNVVAGNGVGITIEGHAADTTLRSNDIVGNGVGLNATGSEDQIDARSNWWGCPDGPEDAACDDVTGPAIYTPWLEQPVRFDVP